MLEMLNYNVKFETAIFTPNVARLEDSGNKHLFYFKKISVAFNVVYF